METKYTIRFVRPVFEKIDIEVNGSCEEEALLSAVHTLMTDKEKEKLWSGQFDEKNYTGFVESISAQDDDDNIEDEDLEDEGLEDENIDGHSKYVILQADMANAEGGVVPQPWLMAQNPFMIADLCQDWISQLTAIEEGEIDDYVRALRPEKSAMIIPFPNTTKPPKT